MTVVASGRAALFNMYYGKSAGPVLILSQGASRQLTWWQGTIPCKLTLWAIYKNLGGAWQTRLVILCACFYKNTWQKSQTKISLKACTEDACYGWHLNCLCKNWRYVGRTFARWRHIIGSYDTQKHGDHPVQLFLMCVLLFWEKQRKLKKNALHVLWNVVVFHSH